MERWSNCPASVRMSEGVESTPSVHAQEGTDAHEVAATVLETSKWPTDLDSDTRDALQVYYDYVRGIQNKATHSNIWIEQRFDLSGIFPGAFGTADCIVMDHDNGVLHVIDYKHGRGVPVEVYENKQLMYYALGAVRSVDALPDRVCMTIVQPRCPHRDGSVRSWEVSLDVILEFAGQLEEAAQRTKDPNEKPNPGSWCKWCPAAGFCPAVTQKHLDVAKTVFSSVDKYDPQKLAAVLDVLPQIEDWVKNVREFAYREACQGRVPPGHKLVNKRAMRKWKDPKKTVQYIEKYLKLHQGQVYDLKLKSPAQIEKELPKDKRNLLDDLIEKKSSGTTLVADSDPREEVNTDPTDVFQLT